MAFDHLLHFVHLVRMARAHVRKPDSTELTKVFGMADRCSRWKIMPPHIWAAFTVLGWGLIATLQSATTTWGGLMACRFFLGLIEAGYGPGIPFLLSFFYLRHEVGLRIGIFFAAAPLANTFAGALAYGITSGSSKLANWRLLFLVEGLPTILMAPVAWYFLPDSPDKARFLTEEEKAVAKARGVRQAGTANRVGGIDWKEVVLALKDPKCWITAVSAVKLELSDAWLMKDQVHVLQLQCQLFITPRLSPGMSLFPLCHHPNQANQ